MVFSNEQTRQIINQIPVTHWFEKSMVQPHFSLAQAQNSNTTDKLDLRLGWAICGRC
jgi:hypothetical protein